MSMESKFEERRSGQPSQSLGVCVAAWSRKKVYGGSAPGPGDASI